MKTTITFEFIAGALSLNLVDTAGRRGESPVERLREPEDLAVWLEAAGLVRIPRRFVTVAALASACELREAIHRCAVAAISRSNLDADDVRKINRTAAQMPLRPKLSGAEVLLSAKNPVEAALSTIAANAIEILADAVRERIRSCPECHMMFFDTSRPGKRRWCSSASGCGNRAKVRKHRARQRRAAPRRTA
jgi:predicted RNA-binding Zn ribbon-like protein